MIHSPLETKALFQVGPVAISEPVIISWVIMAILVLSLRGHAPVGSHAAEAGDDGRSDRRPDPRHDAGRARSVSRTDRDHFRFHTSRQLVIVDPRCRATDRSSGDRRRLRRNRLLRDYLLRDPHARNFRLPRHLCRTDMDHDPAQHRRADHAHVLSHRPPVRQHDERGVHWCDRVVSGGFIGADSLHGPRCADRGDPGLHLHRACNGLHRRGCCRRSRKNPPTTTESEQYHGTTRFN